ncbi:hypothetical protein LCGC14_0527140 [marine sediment metagenome]|uniref:Uncharacterized protein n=1 Tax=marine sediment metagenome TaxID=412755 RepID=A0A0F9RWY2_9ZZZZ
MEDKLKNMPLTRLVIECIIKGIPYEGEGAESLRKKLSPKKSDKD